jgi:hypothetical protein
MNEVEVSNTKLNAILDAACASNEGRGVARLASGTTSTIHAARGILRGWGGFNHARPLCQGHTSRVYFAPIVNQAKPVTCKRCLAAIEKRGLKV